MKIAHVLNPFKCGKDNPSYLFYAQPITFKSMRNAQLQAKKQNIIVELYAANFPEDDEIIPDCFIKLPYLKKSTKTLFPGISGKKKLPIIQEILNLTFKHSKADYIIFTNTDIGVQKNFYVKVNQIIKKNNFTSFIINRKDINKKKNGIKLTDKDEHMNIIYNLIKSGKKHPGKDCFIMKRNLVKRINLKNMFTGYPPWGNTLHLRLSRISKKHKLFFSNNMTFHLGSDKAWQRTGNKLHGKNTQISRDVLENMQNKNKKKRQQPKKQLLWKTKLLQQKKRQQQKKKRQQQQKKKQLRRKRLLLRKKNKNKNKK